MVNEIGVQSVSWWNVSNVNKKINRTGVASFQNWYTKNRYNVYTLISQTASAL